MTYNHLGLLPKMRSNYVGPNSPTLWEYKSKIVSANCVIIQRINC